MSQMVQVVSMLEVPSLFGSVSFQSKEVKGAQNSLFLFCTNMQRHCRQHFGLNRQLSCKQLSYVLQLSLQSSTAMQNSCALQGLLVAAGHSLCLS